MPYEKKNLLCTCQPLYQGQALQNQKRKTRWYEALGILLLGGLMAYVFTGWIGYP